MARARRRSNRRKGARRRAGPLGWILLGLAAGLAVALWVWWSDRQPGAPAVPATPAPPPVATAPPRPAAPPPAVDDRFEFYDVLPSFEVVVPDTTPRGTDPALQPAPIQQPGTYVLQAGSFPEFAQADAVKARLALLGVSSQIQQVVVDDRTFHRVRIGPVEDLGELNRLRSRLRQNRIDFLLIQIRE